jgi:hypothetical protein
MARNLRKKLPMDDTLIVYDINQAATSALVNEAIGGQAVRVASTVREVAEKSVGRRVFLLQTHPPFVDRVEVQMMSSISYLNDLSWGACFGDSLP